MTNYLKTVSGRNIDPFNINPEDIDIQDIAQSLSMQCRYNGHTKKFYSVAEHSVLVSQVLPDEHKLWGLLHDASEAYVGDLISPVKHKIDSFISLENNIQKAVAQHFKLPVVMPDIIHQADKHVLDLELSWLASDCLDSEIGIIGIEPSAAATLFLNCFNSLSLEQNNNSKRAA